MKLTPLDIHHKEFRHSLRGYSEEEVDGFLDQVADEFERLFKENIDMAERLEAALEKVKTYQDMERTLHNTMLAAQKSAEDIVHKAREEADAVLRDAEVKAKEIIHNALTDKQRISGELTRIKSAEEEFRARFSAMIEEYRAGLTEIELPDDVSVMKGDTEDGPVVDVAVVSSPGGGASTDRRDSAAARTIARDASPGRDVARSTPRADASDVAVAAPSFVTGVMLGEAGPPDIPVDVDFDPPREYPMVSFDALGERENDIDIEEID